MIKIFDNVLDNFDEYKRKVGVCKFEDVVSQNVKYRDISQQISGDLIYNKIKKHFNGNIEDKINFLRAYKDDPNYRHPMWIHSDALFADYIAIFFIQASEFWQDDGVSFWRNKDTNKLGIYTKSHTGEENQLVDSQSLYPEKWELFKRVEFKENRIVIAPAAFFHSKTSYGNYGKTIDNCRIVHVLFFNVKKGA
jgi:hypothetical protein